MLELFKPRLVFLWMKKIAILLLFVFCSFSNYAQVRTVFFDVEEKVTSDSTKAETYAIYGQVTGNSLWVFKKYDLSGYLLVSGAFKDESLRIAQGKFVYYDWIDPNDSFENLETVTKGKDRFVVLSGAFEDGLRQGQWLSFYESGEVRNVLNYDKNVFHGEYRSFDSHGDLQESGQFVNNKKEGEWLLKGGLEVVQYKNDQVTAVVKKTRRELKKEKENTHKL
ncbi:hypothetical protein AAKU52_001347 [Pedobacter sp. CG_S7]|uniref:toxin-antitoxin system YwqK family antitoxin n=1 Tax=Pedobacter sp. CG_S7 TaxID=3143930 RepID=UPI00339A1ED7